MATITVDSVIAKAETLIQDQTNTRWSKAEWLDWFNSAVLAVIGLRPDANISNAEFDTVANTALQTIPNDGLRLINVLFNVATGRQIKRIDKRVLDDQVDNWYAAEGTDVEHFVYDERDPKSFWLYPHVTQAHKIRIIYSQAPTPILNSANVIPIDDNYMNPLLDFMLYRAYSKDTDFAQNMQFAQTHLNAFRTALGAKTQSDAMISANTRKE